MVLKLHAWTKLSILEILCIMFGEFWFYVKCFSNDYYNYLVSLHLTIESSSFYTSTDSRRLLNYV